jgi:hypothetical protein
MTPMKTKTLGKFWGVFDGRMEFKRQELLE